MQLVIRPRIKSFKLKHISSTIYVVANDSEVAINYIDVVSTLLNIVKINDYIWRNTSKPVNILYDFTIFFLMLGALSGPWT